MEKKTLMEEAEIDGYSGDTFPRFEISLLWSKNEEMRGDPDSKNEDGGQIHEQVGKSKNRV